MKIVILGSTGYLGYKLTKKLLTNKQNKIICIHRKNSNISKLKELGSEIQLLNIDDSGAEDFLVKEEINCIFNLVCRYPRNSQDFEIIESNLLFPLKFLNYATCKKSMKFISIGTGLPDTFNLYAYTKSQFKNMGEYLSGNNLQFINIELEQFYGCKEPKDRFLHMCIDKLSKNEELNLSKGTQKRDLIHIEDVLNALELILYNNTLPTFVSIPIGSGESPTIKETVLFLSKELKSKSFINFGAVDMRKGEPDSCADLHIYESIGGEIIWDWKSGLIDLLEKEGFR